MKLVTSEEVWPYLRPPSAHCAVEVARRQGLELVAPAGVPSLGARIGIDPTNKVVAISEGDLRYHTHVLGPTGVGKSWLLANMVLDLIESGVGVIVFDPKDGTLVQSILERLPVTAIDRLHIIDLRSKEQAVGINVLETTGEEMQQLVADQVVEIFHQLFAASWGKKSEHVLRAATLTLLRHKDATLCDLPTLLLDAKARGYWTKDLDDPIGLDSFWQEYSQLSDSQRQEWTGALIYKIRDLLLSPRVRHLFGQRKSTIDLSQVLQEREILLVTLPPGEIGRPTMQLVGSILVARIWQLIQARSALPEQWRPDTACFIDEFQEILRMNKSVEEVADQARSFHFGLVLAHQDTAQLKPYEGIERAVRSNVRTKIFFQPQHEEEAKQLAKLLPGIKPEEFIQLRSRQVAVRACLGGIATKPFTAQTLPLPDSDMDKASVERRIRRATELMESVMERDGRPRREVEQELRSRRGQIAGAAEDDAWGVPWT